MVYTGVHGGAIAHPTPFDSDLTPEEELTVVNPTIELLGKVWIAEFLRILYSTNTKDAGTIYLRPFI